MANLKPGADMFGIKITHADGSSGWVVGPDSDYLTFATSAAAAKALKQLLKNDSYSWNCTTEVAKFSK